MDFQFLRGSVSLIREQHPHPAWVLEATDHTSGIVFLRIRFQLYRSLVGLLFSDKERPAEFELNPSEKLGKQKEVKHVWVPIPESFMYDREKVMQVAGKLVKPFEKNGWVADLYGFTKYRNYRDNKCKILFRRWVDRKTKEPEAV